LNDQLLRFGAVGAVGFVVDAGLLVSIVALIDVSPTPARILSFLVAATVTFALNQRFTFGLGGGFSIGRWITYVMTTAVGACINVGIYRIWITHTDTSPLQLVIGTAIGSLAAMTVNYLASSMWVFRPNKHRHSH
jgi:putative flippase GtrA